MISTTEALILGLLAQKSVGAYGSELIHLSGGKLKRGSVYSLLSRLEKSNFVESSEEAATDQYALPRTRYRITAQGTRARLEFANWVGMAVPNYTGEYA